VEVEEGDDHGDGRIPRPNVAGGKKEINLLLFQQSGEINLLGKNSNQFVSGIEVNDGLLKKSLRGAV
jgi:hypothetical protein